MLSGMWCLAKYVRLCFFITYLGTKHCVTVLPDAFRTQIELASHAFETNSRRFVDELAQSVPNTEAALKELQTRLKESLLGECPSANNLENRTDGATPEGGAAGANIGDDVARFVEEAQRQFADIERDVQRCRM